MQRCALMSAYQMIRCRNGRSSGRIQSPSHSAQWRSLLKALMLLGGHQKDAHAQDELRPGYHVKDLLKRIAPKDGKMHCRAKEVSHNL